MGKNGERFLKATFHREYLSAMVHNNDMNEVSHPKELPGRAEFSCYPKLEGSPGARFVEAWSTIMQILEVSAPEKKNRVERDAGNSVDDIEEAMSQGTLKWGIQSHESKDWVDLRDTLSYEERARRRVSHGEIRNPKPQMWIEPLCRNEFSIKPL